MDEIARKAVDEALRKIREGRAFESEEKKPQKDAEKKPQNAPEEEEKIVSAFRNKESIDDFSIGASYSDIKDKGYSLSAGQYFDIKIEYTDITAAEFTQKMNTHKTALRKMFAESRQLEEAILSGFESLVFDESVKENR